MAKTKKNIFSLINTVNKLAVFNTIVGILLAIVLYFLLPSILNYPVNTIDNNFQVEMVGITYSMQYLLLTCILGILIFITFKFSYRKLSNAIRDSDKSSIEDLRKKCFSYPYLTLVIQTFIPTIFCGLLLLVFNTNFELLLRICIVILSLFAIYAITSYMINKQFFEEQLIKTSDVVRNPLAGMRLNIHTKLIIQTFPLFLYSSVILLLLSSSVMTTEKGDLLYHFYEQELITNFPDDKTYELEDIKNKLNSFGLKSEDDHPIIFSAETGDVYYSSKELPVFLTAYARNYYEDTKGQVFEYYGQNIQSAVLKVQTTQGDYFIGIRFFVFGSNIFTPFFIVAILTILFNIFYIYYIGRTLSNDITHVTKGLEQISNLENILLATNIPITSNDEIGILTLEFNKIQDLTKLHVEQIQDNQDKLMEKERLASLGQLIGGIAHNLKTPIMSISGAAEGISDLIKEYDSSIEDPQVNAQDHHDIAKDMNNWISKIKEYTEYMSDVITAVKGQAVTLSDQQTVSFTVEELLKRVDILMKHELKEALVNLLVTIEVDPNLTLKGNVNSLVQVINNMISNSIQAYYGMTDKNIDFIVTIENNHLILTIRDYAGGLPKEVNEKLFKEMITTKGKNGTGLGLFMSYSNIRAHFNGNITFETVEGKGTTFHISLPL